MSTAKIDVNNLVNTYMVVHGAWKMPVWSQWSQPFSPAASPGSKRSCAPKDDLTPTLDGTIIIYYFSFSIFSIFFLQYSTRTYSLGTYPYVCTGLYCMCLSVVSDDM